MLVPLVGTKASPRIWLFANYPIGPCVVSSKLVSDPSKLHIRGMKNGKVLQDCGCEYVDHFTGGVRAGCLTCVVI